MCGSAAVEARGEGGTMKLDERDKGEAADNDAAANKGKDLSELPPLPVPAPFALPANVGAGDGKV